MIFNNKGRIAIMLFKANCLLIVEKPIIKNGRFTTTIRIDNGISVNSAIVREIPMTPPSINILGSKKPFNPKQPILLECLDALTQFRFHLHLHRIPTSGSNKIKKIIFYTKKLKQIYCD